MADRKGAARLQRCDRTNYRLAHHISVTSAWAKPKKWCLQTDLVKLH
jgi:hypothetical protein